MAAEQAIKAKMGRPGLYTLALGAKICELIAAGKSVKDICKLPGMASETVIYEWLAKDGDFAELYTHARARQADLYAAQIVEIADEDCAMVQHPDGESGEVAVVFDSVAVQRNRLRVDARKWVASKLAPKKYSEKVAIGGADDLPAIKSVYSMTEAQLLAIASGKSVTKID